MTTAARRVVIIGGGTAGWITAGIIAREHPGAARVVLVESPDIPIIGVGEGTWPSMRRTLQRIGLREADLVRQCDASFKQGTEFVGWRNDAGTDRYYHPFSLPAEYSTLNLADYWSVHGRGTAFSDFVTPQSGVIAAALAPKQLGTPEYAFNVNYGYHLDAGRFATLLRDHVTSQANVRHVRANLAGIESLPDGDIAAITLDSGERIAGDLFVDCTGQQSLLIGRHYGVKLESVRNILPNDRAIAAQVPYAADPAPIPSTTIATAMPGGWIWDIGLQSRRGVGYVHSSAHVSESDARAALTAYIRQISPTTDTDALGFRTLSFEPGYRLTPWVHNCVAVGLSAGFIEPLEASALAMIEQAACFLGDQLPQDRQVIEILAARFNRKMVYHWERIVEFLKLHYVLSRRENTAYWRDCRATDSWPASLAEKMQLWCQQAPWHDDAPRFDELFPSASFQYVLYGMGFEAQYSPINRQGYQSNLSRADSALQEVRRNRSRLTDILPGNRELLDAMVRGEHGMNTARSA